MCSDHDFQPEKYVHVHRVHMCNIANGDMLVVPYDYGTTYRFRFVKDSMKVTVVIEKWESYGSGDMECHVSTTVIYDGCDAIYIHPYDMTPKGVMYTDPVWGIIAGDKWPAREEEPKMDLGYEPWDEES